MGCDGNFARVVALLIVMASLACRPQGPPGLSERDLADGIHTVLLADREIYTQQVVNRLQNQEKVLKASEHWKDDKLLPLPAQMFRMGAERAREQTKAFTYALRSLSPINKQNRPQTDAEKAGLQAVADHPDQNSYVEETIAGVSYLTAIYPDRAVSQACVDCHDSHPESPRKDFKVGDVMGAMVIRVVRR